MNGSEIARCSIIWFDADALLRDPKNPSFTDERYHQGDHLHPNQAGGMLLAQAYDLQKLTGEA